MSRLPRVSAMRPQMGAITADTTNDAENTTPDQRFTCSGAAPSSDER